MEDPTRYYFSTPVIATRLVPHTYQEYSKLNTASSVSSGLHARHSNAYRLVRPLTHHFSAVYCWAVDGWLCFLFRKPSAQFRFVLLLPFPDAPLSNNGYARSSSHISSFYKPPTGEHWRVTRSPGPSVQSVSAARGRRVVMLDELERRSLSKKFQFESPRGLQTSLWWDFLLSRPY